MLALREFCEKNKKLLHISQSVRYPGLKVIKYDRSVFYGNKWHVSDLLFEARGVVVDKDWNVVVKPFTKIFNRGENGTNINRDEMVTCIRKINGFMASATYVPEFDKVIVSTTGSLDSNFVAFAEKYITDSIKDKIANMSKLTLSTFLFEIVHEDDPHIISENVGAYLIGRRNVNSNEQYHSNADLEYELDNIAKELGVYRPEWTQCRFSDVVRNVKNVKHEGFVVYGNNTALKIKSPYYLFTKFMARLRADKLLELNFNTARNKVDEEFYDIIDYIWNNKAWFVSLKEQERIAAIAKFLRKTNEV